MRIACSGIEVGIGVLNFFCHRNISIFIAWAFSRLEVERIFIFRCTKLFFFHSWLWFLQYTERTGWNWKLHHSRLPGSKLRRLLQRLTRDYSKNSHQEESIERPFAFREQVDYFQIKLMAHMLLVSSHKTALKNYITQRKLSNS